LPHHNQQASDDENPTEHAQMLSSYHASAESHPANRRDFFNTHGILRQQPF
jgi:hypothetical protein